MANPEQVERLKKGGKSWYDWRISTDELPDLSRADLIGANLTGANLSRADLIGANLTGANLSGANLSGANLSGADLSGANLSGANLSGADLGWANLSGANLSGANLSGAALIGADLRGADLGGANLIGAYLGGTHFNGTHIDMTDFASSMTGLTIFGDVDLSTAKGLESVIHEGPSTIGIDTLYKSGGKIPEAFLRGAGVPENLITFMHSLVGEPIQYHSCFISYSTKDEPFAQRLYADLQAKGVRCWFAPEDMKGGRYLHSQIDEAIQIHDRLLLLLSKDSMASQWVQREIAKARLREQRENRRMLFPVRLVDFNTLEEWKCLDPMTGEDHAPEIRKYFIPDFSNWKDHDSYQGAFDRLLRDLTENLNKKS